MGEKDDPFGTEKPSTDPFGRPISESDTAFSAAESDDASTQDAFGSSAAADRAPPPQADDPWRTPPPPPPSGDDVWRTAPPPADDPAARPAPTKQAESAAPALILGILSIFCGLLAPFAWALGRKAERAIDASGGTLGGRGTATAGKILGIVITVLMILGILFIVLGVIVGATSIEEGGTTTTFEF